MSTQIISNNQHLMKKEEKMNQQRLEWRSKAKSQLIVTSRTNMMKRLTKIVNTVNEYDPLLNKFEMNTNDIRRMFGDVDNAINSWRGVDINSCKTQKTSFKQYKVTATNWFNRNKAKIYGNYFFCPLIFKYILNFCRNIECKSMRDSDKMALFINVFLSIFDGKITFPRTKAQPLMPYQTLIQPNEFRAKCKELILFYNLEWNHNTISPSKVHRVYQKDKCRSHKIFSSFIQCLKSIQLILSSPSTASKYSFFRADHKIHSYSNRAGNGPNIGSVAVINTAPNIKNEAISYTPNYTKSDDIKCDDQCINIKPIDTTISDEINHVRPVYNDEISNNSDSTPITTPIIMDDGAIHNGLSPSMNALIQSVLSEESNTFSLGRNNMEWSNNRHTNCIYMNHSNINNRNNMNNNGGNSGLLQINNTNTTNNNINNIQINTLNINGNYMVNNNNNNNNNALNGNIGNNGIRVRYKLLSIHPSLPPIVLSQNLV